MFKIKGKWRTAAWILVILFWVFVICYGFGDWQIPPSKKDVPRLIKKLKSEDASTRRDAADDLGKIGPDAVAAVPDLIKALDDSYMEIRKNSASALGEIGPNAREAVPALIGKLDDPESLVRGNAALSLGLIGPEPGVVNAIISALDDEKVFVRSFAAAGLSNLGANAEPALPKLEDLLAHSEEGTHENLVLRSAINTIRTELVNKEFGWE